MDLDWESLRPRFEQHLPQVESWIDDALRQTSSQARPLSSLKFPRLFSYFSPKILSETKVVVTNHIPKPPLSQLGLAEFLEFERMEASGITYKNTYFILPGRSGDESLHFHELVHTIQWKVAGPKDFMLAYAVGLAQFGYRESPLEVMAYDQQERFDAQELIPVPNLEILVAKMTEAIIGDPLNHPWDTMMRRIQKARGIYAPEFNAEVQEMRKLKALSRAEDARRLASGEVTAEQLQAENSTSRGMQGSGS